MFTQQEQEEFNRILADPIDFLMEEFDWGGVFNTSIFGYDDIQDDQIILSLGQAGTLYADLTVWGQCGNSVSRVHYLAFWNKQSGWELHMVSRLGVSPLATPLYEQQGQAFCDGEKEWEETVQKVSDNCKPAVALYYPGGTLGAESSPESTSFYANEKAKEAGVIVV